MRLLYRSMTDEVTAISRQITQASGTSWAHGIHRRFQVSTELQPVVVPVNSSIGCLTRPVCWSDRSLSSLR